MKRQTNQFCRVKSRLFSHREEGVGKRSQGNKRARAINGMPRYVGLINWSKKLRIMVSFRALFLVLGCFEGRVRWGMCGPWFLAQQW